MHNKTAERVKSNLKIRKLRFVLILISSYLVVEIIAGFYTGSLALIADAGHMFADSFGIGLALIAVYYSRKEATPVHTFGFFRTEILASLFNSVILCLISIIIIYEAFRRFVEPVEIQSDIMIAVASVGLIINILGIYLLKDQHIHNHQSNNIKNKQYPEDVHNNVPKEMSYTTKRLKDESETQKIEDLNLKGARLELLSDTLGSAGVIAGGLIIVTTNFVMIDTILSIGLAVFIFPRIWSLLRKSVHILMEGVPSTIAYDKVQQSILQVKGVTGIFDLHIWSITSGMHSLSAHVVVMDLTTSNYILQEINSLLESRFNITHSTIQIEKYHPSDQ